MRKIIVKNNQINLAQLEKLCLQLESKLIYNKKYTIPNNNILSNDYTLSVSTLAYIKNYTSNSINTQNVTEGHNNKYRVNLLSAFSNSYNNIFIPFFPVQTLIINFNIGGQLNMENFSKERMTNVNSNLISQKEIMKK